MKKLITIIISAVIFISFLSALWLSDKNTKKTAGFLGRNVLFGFENGTVTIFNEEIRLK